jgi:hypothetical protein
MCYMYSTYAEYLWMYKVLLIMVMNSMLYAIVTIYDNKIFPLNDYMFVVDAYILIILIISTPAIIVQYYIQCDIILQTMLKSIFINITIFLLAFVNDGIILMILYDSVPYIVWVLCVVGGMTACSAIAL